MTTWTNLKPRMQSCHSEEPTSTGRTTKLCRKCGQTKKIEEFGILSRGGVQGYCKPCRSAGTQARYRSLPPVEAWARWTTSNIKARAKEMGVPCSITWQQLAENAPDVCPVLGIDLHYVRGQGGRGSWGQCPSVDRWNPNEGYVLENISIISQRANAIKTNATAQQVAAVAEWMRRKSLEDGKSFSDALDYGLRDKRVFGSDGSNMDDPARRRRRRRRRGIR